ncbi:hypothetical protein B6S59_04570 [Pseudomonas sp. A46]|jgi:hypothetical protein|uniref:PA2779 family protein n=1 Tax=Metapseudomonas furukawaii TaxID=1149133 RepID=UPI000B49F75B|nr:MULTISPECIES: PA2779 family protein [Pseudomonas]OWJ97229.1 hypothetical protein B6S59_04570 [Pseudomonas sp. A46]WAG77542.1 PA2779 family protein [Pseudomonas furukawaii]
MKPFTLIVSAIVLLLCLGLLPSATAQAGMIGTQDALQQGGDHARIDAFLRQSEVEKQLRAMGVDAATARGRAQALTPAEAAQLVQKMDAMPAGGRIDQTDFIIILLVVILVAILL